MLAVVVAPAVGFSAGAAARTWLAAAAEADRTQLTQVDAVLQSDPPPIDGSGEGVAWTGARWFSPAGVVVEGRVPVPADRGAVHGDHVPIWVTPTGERHRAPQTGSQIRQQAASIGLVSAFGTVLGAVFAYVGGVALLDRSRHRAWARGWSEVEPSWRRRMMR
ncbi:hypothetical protein TEK04_10600 [Klenkia sp. LSe6-5]|uniref:Uncharacterized protein n=1 Tax=Klenkia sesuvii TaxID=3103137 RepID=A0ABU8DU54_9ACTN